MTRDGDVPDFAALFKPEPPELNEDHSPDAWYLTPRVAAQLWTVAGFMYDFAREDIREWGDKPVGADPKDFWRVFDEYPRITFRQGVEWRQRAAKCFSDLKGDLARGEWPVARCVGEEMALRLMFEQLNEDPMHVNFLEEHDEWYRTLPTTQWDGEDGRDSTYEVLVMDDDLSGLFDAQVDGIEDPSSDENLFISMGDYRPAAWFNWFANSDAREA